MSCNAIRTLVESFENELIEKGLEIVVVDNGSSDETPESIPLLKRELMNENILIHYVRLNENIGYSVGVNIGLSHCRGKLVGIVNNDLLFPKGWINPILNIFMNDSNIGLCAPYLSNATGIQNVGVSFENYENMNLFAQEFMEKSRDQHHFVQRVIGACMIFRKEVLDLIGGNDFWYGLGNYDDDDLCLRTIIAGYKIMIVGGTFVHHIGHLSFNQVPGLIQACYWANTDKFKLKWKLSGEKDYYGNYVIPDSVLNRPYSRESDFFPVRLEDFESKSPVYEKKNNERYLLIADWSNHLSKWKAALMKASLNHQECEVWIPENYFDKYGFKSQMDHLVSIANQIGIGTRVSMNFDSVPPVQLLNFINNYKGVIRVQDDFVNQYIVYLAEGISLDII